MNPSMATSFKTLSPDIALTRSDASAQPGSGVLLSIIVPTFNEAGSIGELIRRVGACLPSTPWEMLIVDDESTDGTADIVAELGRDDDRIRCLRRVGRRGLSSACMEGMALASGSYYAVMDADLQHDEQLLPAMLRSIASGDVDLVVGSRYVDGGCVEAWNPVRLALSRLATGVTRLLLRVRLSDPMSGFFMIRREAMLPLQASCQDKGFKLLLDVVASSTVPLRVVELPYRFAIRTSGQSKLGAGVAWHFLVLLSRHLARRMPLRFLKFCMVGGSGVLVHFAVLCSAQQWLEASFPVAQTSAVLVSIASNFWLNNRLAFGDLRLRGTRVVAGMSRFAGLCAFGAVVNVILAMTLQGSGVDRTLSAAAGVLAGAVCNYLTVSRLVWRS